MDPVVPSEGKCLGYSLLSFGRVSRTFSGSVWIHTVGVHVTFRFSIISFINPSNLQVSCAKHWVFAGFTWHSPEAKTQCLAQTCLTFFRKTWADICLLFTVFLYFLMWHSPEAKQLIFWMMVSANTGLMAAARGSSLSLPSLRLAWQVVATGGMYIYIYIVIYSGLMVDE